MAKISVIIPVYNVEKYLVRCLDSVLGQTFKDFEVICVNDGSPDKSGEILSEYSKKDNRITVITQTNQGLSVARNNGLKIAKGEYVCFCDSDDTLHPQCFEITYELIRNYDADMLQFRQMDYIWDEKSLTNPFVHELSAEMLDVHFSVEPVFLGTHKGTNIINFTATSKLYKRSFLDNIRFIPKIHFEDYPHTYAVLAKYPKTVILNEILYYYTVNPNSIFHQNNSLKQLKDYYSGIKYIFDIYGKEHTKEREFLARDFVPNILEQQRRRCRHATGDEKKKMYAFFAEELRWLECQSLLKKEYIKLHRFLLYKFLILFFKESYLKC